MTSSLKHYLSALCILALTACSSTKPSTKQPEHKQLYTNEQAWKVKINDGWFSAKTITLGSYETSSRKNGVTADPALRFVRDPKNPFSFSLTAGEEKIPVQALSTSRIAFSNRTLPAFLENLPTTTPVFYVLIHGSSEYPLQRWELILKNPTYLELNDNKPVGILRSSDEEIRVSAHNRFGVTNAYEKMVFEFRQHGRPIAAVMPGEEPRIWVSSVVTAPTQKMLAAAIASLLYR